MLYYVLASSKGEEVKFLLDSGCDTSYISMAFVEKCGLRESVVPNSKEKVKFPNLSVKVLGAITMTLDFGGKSVPFTFGVMPDRSLLGLDFLHKFNCSFHLSKNPTMRFGQEINTAELPFEARIIMKYSCHGNDLPLELDTGSSTNFCGMPTAKRMGLELKRIKNFYLNDKPYPYNAYENTKPLTILIKNTQIEILNLRVVDLKIMNEFHALRFGIDAMDNTFWDFEQETVTFNYQDVNEVVVPFWFKFMVDNEPNRLSTSDLIQRRNPL